MMWVGETRKKSIVIYLLVACAILAVIFLLSNRENMLLYDPPPSWGLESCINDGKNRTTCFYRFWTIHSLACISTEHYFFVRDAEERYQERIDYRRDKLTQPWYGVEPSSFKEYQIDVCGTSGYVFEYVREPVGDFINDTHNIEVYFTHDATFFDISISLDVVESRDIQREIDLAWEMIENLECVYEED